MQREWHTALLCLLVAAGGCSGGGGGTGDKRNGQGGYGSGDQPPSITGSPVATAVVGEFYSFTPSAHDPEGGRLKYGIRRKPPWATFDAQTGRLSGTPRPGDIGSHVDIAIWVSDGQHKVTLPEFAVTVNGRGDGAATLSWHPPTRKADGTYLSDLAGYRIYYGHSAGKMKYTIVLTNPGLTRYMVEGLSARRWFFAMTAFDSQGNESRRSKTVHKRVG